MLKETITYETFDGETITEDFYFHYSKAELAELELSHDGGLTEMLKDLIKTNDGKKIIDTFKDLVLGAYGVKSKDGKRFIKSDELRESFSQTEAYSEFFMSLALDAEKAAKFVNGIVPSGIAVPQDHLQKQIETTRAEILGEPEKKATGDLTDAELLELPREELIARMNEAKRNNQ